MYTILNIENILSESESVVEFISSSIFLANDGMLFKPEFPNRSHPVWTMAQGSKLRRQAATMLHGGRWQHPRPFRVVGPRYPRMSTGSFRFCLTGSDHAEGDEAITIEG